MTADPLARLDQLDEAHTTGARGQVWSFDALVALKRLGLDHEPAELIVAAVNSLPKLTAALRAVVKRHHPVLRWAGDDHDTEACATCFDKDENPEVWPCPTVQAITAALAPEQVQS